MNRAIIVVLLVFFVCSFFNDQVWSAYVKRQSLVKPGICPKSKGGSCVEECKGDGDCPGREKCCSNGCGHVCMKPVNVPVKPNRCPKPIGPGLCVQRCSEDDDCPLGTICCSNGCGHECTKPASGKRELKPRPGSCPKPQGPGLCAEMCGIRGGCGEGQKCCFNGCGHQCMDTV